MKTARLTDDSGLPMVHTAIARLFMPPSPPAKPEGVDAMLMARDRLHEPEVIRTAAFCALWSFIATGCFLPWGGLGIWMIVRSVACLLLWVPAWMLALQSLVVLPGILCQSLEARRILVHEESLMLSQGVAVLGLSVAAAILLMSSCVACRIVGGIWLSVLLLEGLLWLVVLTRKKLVS